MAKGEWLRTPTGWAYCSVCGCEPPEETNIITKFCPNCGAEMENYKLSIVTNADRIRAMTDEELAKFLDCYCVSASWECPKHHEIKCHECWLEWLKKEVDDG